MTDSTQGRHVRVMFGLKQKLSSHTARCKKCRSVQNSLYIKDLEGSMDKEIRLKCKNCGAESQVFGIFHIEEGQQKN